MVITDLFLTNHNRPKKKLIKLKGIVIHWTANTTKGADARANRDYFNTTKESASAHYIVDDKEIIRCVPDDEVCFHVGARVYTDTGEMLRMKPYSPNYFLIGIEMCVNVDADLNQVYKNTVELTAELLNKYKLKIDDLYRHYDITGKCCPRMFVVETEWNKFKQAVITEMKKTKVIVNGKYVDIEPVFIHDRAYLPARALAEMLEFTVEWDSVTRTIKISKRG